MRAAWCDRLGDASAVAVRDVPVPGPGPGQALVRVHAAALNFPDVLMVAGRYQVRLDPPFIPGTEFAGEVVCAPNNAMPVGARVTGVVPHGAFAEYVAADPNDLRPLPAGLDFIHGAAFQVTYRTAYHALVTIGGAQPGQSVVVLGAAGGVGLATVDVASRLGLRVIAAASSEQRLALCREFGAHHTVDYSTDPLKERLKALAPNGADIVVDPVGGRFAEPALRAIAWGGRFVSVGYAAGEIPRLPLNLVLLKGAQVRGFEMRGLAAHLPEAIDRCEDTLTGLVAAGMRPHIGARHPLDDVRGAFSLLADRRALGKVVVIP